ncbi:MAG TPA: hypothetical protein PLY23_06570 [Alphaproteobacteria bacterium]|nr:hypothetical protein [Alphaproteobacteria bacterium]HQS94342.1 hypothetical protein [Alphaproteobacteria bacterium]
MNLIKKNEVKKKPSHFYGVPLGEKASSLTQGHMGIGGEGRFWPCPYPKPKPKPKP